MVSINKEMQSPIIVRILTEPNRLRIAKFLLNSRKIYLGSLTSEKPCRIKEIADALNLKRTLVIYHLMELERHKLIKSELIILEEPTETKKGKAGRVFSLTKDGKVIVELVSAFIKDLENKI